MPDDPSLRPSLAGLQLRNPIGLAAGFDKTCAHLDALGELGFGYVVGGTITRAARGGEPEAAIVRYPAKASMVNAMGLPNPGAERRGRVSRAASAPSTPALVSVADEAIEDAAGGIRAVGAALPTPSSSTRAARTSRGAATATTRPISRDLLDALRALAPQPVFVKLPPFTTPVEREVVLALARDRAGARRGRD